MANRPSSQSPPAPLAFPSTMARSVLCVLIAVGRRCTLAKIAAGMNPGVTDADIVAALDELIARRFVRAIGRSYIATPVGTATFRTWVTITAIGGAA